MKTFLARLLVKAASMVRSEEGRNQLLMALLIPLAIVIVAVSAVAYIISSPFSALGELFGEEELGLAESIWDSFNASGTSGSSYDFVYYSQYDLEWAMEPYSGGTIASHGCGPTSLAMVIATFTQDEKYDPSSMAQYLVKGGQTDPKAGTYHSAFAYAINRIAESEDIEMTIKEFAGTQWAEVAKEMEKANVLVIARVSGGKWTGGSGHFIVLRGFDEDGNVLVGDPASKDKSQVGHAPSSVSTAASKYWVITGPVMAGSGEYNWPFHCAFSIDAWFWKPGNLWSCKHHTGQDFNASPEGSMVFAVGPGKVIVSRYSKSYGNEVQIMHPDGYLTLYAHLSERLVKVGDIVDADTPLGHESDTGNAYGKHLHFEVHKGSYSYPKNTSSPPSSPIDPMLYLKWHGVEK